MVTIDASVSLRVERLSAGYRRRRIIDELSLPAFKPGLYSLIGPNAAGKSTLLRALGGLLPAQGRVFLGDTDLASLSLAERSQFVTYMPQSIPEGIGLSVFETVLGALHATPAAYTDGGEQAALERAANMLAAVGMDGFAMEPLGSLSGGQRQLVSLAQALVREPRVLLLDEPISALDLKHQWRVMQLVRELADQQQMIVLAVLHDLQIAAHWSDGIVVLKKGGLAATGKPHEAITPAVLADVYGVAARVEPTHDGRLQVLVDTLV